MYGAGYRVKTKDRYCLCKVITLLPHRLEAGALDSSARTFFKGLFFFSIGYYSGCKVMTFR